MNFKNFLTSFKNKHNFSIVDNNYISENNSNTPLINTSSNSDTAPQDVSNKLSDNLLYMQTMYNSLINSDVKIREFSFKLNRTSYNAFIIFFDGMTNSTLVNNFLLKPLMNENKSMAHYENSSLENYIFDCLIPQNSINKVNSFSEIASSINSGNCILFVDTISAAFDIDVKGFQQRSVTTPVSEMVIKGPQEAFVENIRVNTSLIRRLANTENLIIENITIGNISKTKCGLCYFQNIANGDLVSEVKYRLNNLDIDSLISTGQLEQLIEESGMYGIPQIVSTERPDKCVKFLYEGRVVILVNGNPYALILPATFTDFLTSAEDTNLRPSFTNFLRMLRLFGFIVTLLLPGMYIAITSFHQEFLPTELLFTIMGSRESVPFPIIFELLLLEISFEIIREAGVRVPSPIGSTISIVGGLIIGESAVSANLVSPILVIIVAVTAIASFAIPDFSFGFHLRILRFVFILLGFVAGFLGIGIGIFVYLSILCNMKSFGVPLTSPFAPSSVATNVGYVVPPTWKQDNRSSFVSPQKPRSQSRIAKKWEKS
ncbi:MAG: spore germination protein [Clostridia bacterium]|nr:spore germination protein [Clostridia bacterium]